jgi:hypothetical protein
MGYFNLSLDNRSFFNQSTFAAQIGSARLVLSSISFAYQINSHYCPSLL